MGKVPWLPAGQYVTPDKQISKGFGKEKSGDHHYVHAFHVQHTYQPTHTVNGRKYLDLSKPEEGHVARDRSNGEEWENYRTKKPLKPVHTEEY